ncbi:MAG: peptidylprolyl isomerase [Cyanobacteria bacterium P01_A01_bin.84]
MSEVIQVGNQTMKAEEIISSLAAYKMLPQLLRELIIDRAIASIECTPEEVAHAQKQFYAQHQITSEADMKAWTQFHGLSFDQLGGVTTRQFKIEKFKQISWGNQLESYFFEHKSKFDKVIYCLLRTQDGEVAQEIYFRIMGGEQSFADLAQEYSQGPEAQTGGLVGPVELASLHPAMVEKLSTSQPGKLLAPIYIAGWFVILRLEKLVPAQLDEAMEARLLNELFQRWLNEQLQQEPRGEQAKVAI